MAGRHTKFIRKQSLLRVPSRVGLLLGILWALPLTLFGALLALPVLAMRGKLQVIREPGAALLVSGHVADYLLSRHPYGAMAAMALGHIIIADRRSLSSRIIIHELAHVRQAMHWGIIFPFAYLASSAWARMRGQDAYWHNRFEIAAREAEKHF
ncbi:MAG: hypothetical protein JWR25_358 [Noviherbaspirillum sp.]|jgi:hypothetical protein|nr:hypothetical protein [Noviherbaspirillum sp.]MDB5793979.1 hypothetical protein [Noviherbaspirillum sp.]